MANTITNDYYLSNAAKPQKQTGNSSLGKDAFMQILVKQLQNQDPTNPMNDRDFIAQMAQFSSLEQMQNMTKAMESLLSSQQQSQLMNYSTFIGKEVQWHEITDKTDASGKAIVNDGKGTISQLKFVDGEAVFTLADGKELRAGNISAILNNNSSSNSNSTSDLPLVQASMLIGKTVSYLNNSVEAQGKVVSVSNKEGNLTYILEDGTKVLGNQLTTISQ